MTVNNSRSMNQDLAEGATDGTFRKVRPNTVDNPANTAATNRARQHLHAYWNYGYATTESPDQVNPGK